MESTATTNPDKVLTDDGLTLKGVKRIERINCDAKFKDVSLRSWQCSRLLRRDFYLVTYKMFFVLRTRFDRARVRDLLADIQEEANALEHVTRRYELPALDGATVLKLRLVNDEAQTLLDTILTADKAISKMKDGPLNEVMAENIAPYFAAFNRLKSFVLAQNSKEAGNSPVLEEGAAA